MQIIAATALTCFAALQVHYIVESRFDLFRKKYYPQVHNIVVGFNADLAKLP